MHLHSTTKLLDGTRARVRLPHGSDRAGLHALHGRLGLTCDELELARKLHFDPRRRAVAVLVAWDGAAERLVGYGAVDVGAAELDVLLVDPGTPEGGEVLATALLAHTGRDRAAA